MASNPENKHTPSYHPEGFSILDSVMDHAVLGSAFGLWLAFNPRRVLSVLTKEGLEGVVNGYRTFFKNERPTLYYSDIKQ